MARSNSHFQRGLGVFNCISCGRRTRGMSDVIGTDCCAQCFELAGLDNMINDDHRRPTSDETAEAELLLAEISAKGGDAQQVRDHSSYIFPQTVEVATDPAEIEAIEDEAECFEAPAEVEQEFLPYADQTAADLIEDLVNREIEELGAFLRKTKGPQPQLETRLALAREIRDNNPYRNKK